MKKGVILPRKCLGEMKKLLLEAPEGEKHVFRVLAHWPRDHPVGTEVAVPVSNLGRSPPSTTRRGR